MIAKLQVTFLIVLIWIQTANSKMPIEHENLSSQYVLRFILLLIVFSILILNIIILESLRSKSKFFGEGNLLLPRLIYPIIVTSISICLNEPKSQIFVGILLLTFIFAVDWFDEFKNFKNAIIFKINEYRMKRGYPVAVDEFSSLGLFKVLVIDGVLIFIAMRKIFD